MIVVTFIKVRGVICKVQILHYYECGWSCDLKKVVCLMSKMVLVLNTAVHG